MMRHGARSVPAVWGPTAKPPAGRATGSWLSGRALGDEADGGLQPARVLLETDVLVVVDGDLVLRTKEARGCERRHRTLGAHHETLAASDKPAGKPT